MAVGCRKVSERDSAILLVKRLTALVLAYGDRHKVTDNNSHTNTHTHTVIEIDFLQVDNIILVCLVANSQIATGG